MFRAIVLAALLAIVSCRPQVRLSRPVAAHNFGPGSRASPILNAVAAPLHDQEPLQIPLSNVVRTNPSSSSGVPLRNAEPSESEIYQNQNARYEFSSDVEDHINDLSQQRQEVREGSTVKGMYSYSDGYYKRTVHYIADEDGYRVTGMEAEPLNGPQIDLMGTASVSNNAHGTELKYSVVSVPVSGPVSKIVDN